MDPKPYLATSSGYHSSFPIRAPLTLDSDTESSHSSESHKNDINNVASSNNSGIYNSDVTGFESEGFLSGEDDFETASERPFLDHSSESSGFVPSHVGFRPFVNDPDEGSVENDRFVEDTGGLKPFENDPDDGLAESRNLFRSHVGFRPFVNDPDEESNGNDGFVEDTGGLKPFENDPDDDSAENRDFVRSHVGFRPFVNDPYGDLGADPGKESIENDRFVKDTGGLKPFEKDFCVEINKNGVSRAYVSSTSGDFSESSVLDIGVLTNPKLIIPTAKLSRDSDDESLVFEDVEDDDFLSSDRLSDIHSLEKAESGLRLKVYADEDSEEEKYGSEPEMSTNVGGAMELQGGEIVASKVLADEDFEGEEGSKFKPELDKTLFDKTNVNAVENTALQGSEIVANGADYTFSFVEETKGTVSTKLMEKSGDLVKDSQFVETDSADAVERENLGAEMEDGQRNYVFDPLLISALDLEFSGEIKDKDCYGNSNSEISFSIDDYSTGSIVDDIEQYSSPNALEESSKDFWRKTEVDTHGESEGKEVFIPNTSEISPRQNLSEEQKKNIEQIKLVRVKFFRLVQRLGLSIEDSIASQLLYRLNLIERGPLDQLFTFVSAMNTVMELECENGKGDSDFSLNILVIGKTGVGKSATVNSIFREEKVSIGAFEPGTTCVKEIIGTIDGIKIRIFDTPGLKLLSKDQSFNMKILSSTKRIMRKCPPDIVLYMDRLDMEKRELDDLPLLRSITRCLGSSIWQKTVVTLTHACSTPPDGPNGLPLSYDLYVAQRLRAIQLMISQSLRRNVSNASSVCSVSLVENHSLSQEGGNGEKVLLNGEKWRPRLLLLCSSMKILSEAKVFEEDGDHDRLLPLMPLTETPEENKKILNGLDQSSGNLSMVGFSFGRGPKVVFQAGLDGKLKGQGSVKIKGFEQLQIVLLGTFSVINAIVRRSS